MRAISGEIAFAVMLLMLLLLFSDGDAKFSLKDHKHKANHYSAGNIRNLT